jgi:hypothetical protein
MFSIFFLVVGMLLVFFAVGAFMAGSRPSSVKKAKKGFEPDSRPRTSLLWLKIQANWDELALAELEAIEQETKVRLLTRKLIAQQEINRLTEVLVNYEKRNKKKLEEVGLSSEDDLL